MFNQIFKIEISANSVAWYAAIISTVSVGVSIFNALKDRARVKITFQKKMLITGNYGPYPYTPDQNYCSLKVINKGFRPVHIEQIGAGLIKGGYLIFADSFNAQKNKLLDEKNPSEFFLVPERTIEYNKISYFYALDKKGVTYKKYLTKFPTFKKYLSNYLITKLGV